MKHLRRTLAFALAVGVFGAVSAWAEAQHSDSITISMTPPQDYSITVEGNIDFGAVELDTVYLSTSIAISTVTNSGNMVSDWKIKGDAVNTWVLDHSGGKDAAGANQAVLCAVLTATTTATVADDAFTNNDVIMSGGTLANMIGAAFSVDGLINGDDVPADGQRRIWFRLKTPTSSTVGEEQQFTVTIEAWASDAF